MKKYTIQDMNDDSDLYRYDSHYVFPFPKFSQFPFIHIEDHFPYNTYLKKFSRVGEPFNDIQCDDKDIFPCYKSDTLTKTVFTENVNKLANHLQKQLPSGYIVGTPEIKEHKILTGKSLLSKTYKDYFQFHIPISHPDAPGCYFHVTSADWFSNYSEPILEKLKRYSGDSLKSDNYMDEYFQHCANIDEIHANIYYQDNDKYKTWLPLNDTQLAYVVSNSEVLKYRKSLLKQGYSIPFVQTGQKSLDNYIIPHEFALYHNVPGFNKTFFMTPCREECGYDVYFNQYNPFIRGNYGPSIAGAILIFGLALSRYVRAENQVQLPFYKDIHRNMSHEDGTYRWAFVALRYPWDAITVTTKDNQIQEIEFNPLVTYSQVFERYKELYGTNLGIGADICTQMGAFLLYVKDGYLNDPNPPYPLLFDIKQEFTNKRVQEELACLDSIDADYQKDGIETPIHNTALTRSGRNILKYAPQCIKAAKQYAATHPEEIKRIHEYDRNRLQEYKKEVFAKNQQSIEKLKQRQEEYNQQLAALQQESDINQAQIKELMEEQERFLS